ncbi:hypothetical protein C8R44DRAFT_747078 [Mycena epipterygia]|nr:hypothetical protein C8R44DRAFT_747078 [Mycena epipterygia]
MAHNFDTSSQKPSAPINNLFTPPRLIIFASTAIVSIHYPLKAVSHRTLIFAGRRRKLRHSNAVVVPAVLTNAANAIPAPVNPLSGVAASSAAHMYHHFESSPQGDLAPCNTRPRRCFVFENGTLRPNPMSLRESAIYNEIRFGEVLTYNFNLLQLPCAPFVLTIFKSFEDGGLALRWWLLNVEKEFFLLTPFGNFDQIARYSRPVFSSREISARILWSFQGKYSPESGL